MRRAVFALLLLVHVPSGNTWAATITQIASGGGAAFGVSADGSTVVGYAGDVPGNGFRWTRETGAIGLGTLPGAVTSSPGAISADGSTIAGKSEGTNLSEAAVWTSDGHITSLGAPSGGASDATGVSGDGSIVVGSTYDFALGFEAFLWTSSAGMVGMGFLPGGTQSEAAGISADGSIVVGWSSSEAFRWTSDEGMVGLGRLYSGGGGSAAHAISADGSTIVGTSTIAFHRSGAFRWTSSEGMVALGNPVGGISSNAFAVSADGSVIVGEFRDVATSETRPFIWDAANGIRPLDEVLTDLGVDLSDWGPLGTAYGISADGHTIVGQSDPGTGFPQAWIAVIPEPATGTLLGASLLAIGLFRRRAPRSNSH